MSVPNDANSNDSNEVDQTKDTVVDESTAVPETTNESQPEESTNVETNNEVKSEETKSGKDSKDGGSLLSKLNFNYLLVGALTIFAMVQNHQITSLQSDIVWLHSEIQRVETKEEAPQKFAIMSFEDTVKAWREVDPTGQAISKIMDSTIQSYNAKGITIIDSTAVIGGRGNLEFINVSPSRYMEDAKNEE
ncbi:hypothetical protein OH460_09145 [Vibrio sp. Makdt]|uniref:hypothetical protein n=1 Tax=Vibrio sp. Makdt TaxID=2998828 RepID=UPI0022CDB494|nr:hypothetical protein [Vibrio sp. Makdt]MDA0152468.1 hypothetical protein [Vibrio sp. Makdt]